MRERAAELGGICVVSGLPDAGTQVEVMLPLSPSRRHAPKETPAKETPAKEKSPQEKPVQERST
jgi:hypothetical protein